MQLYINKNKPTPVPVFYILYEKNIFFNEQK